MHHIKVIKDGNVNNVVKEQLVDGVQYVDNEPHEGSFNGITSGAVAKIAEHVTTAEDDIDSIEGKIPSGASSSNKLVTESGMEDALSTIGTGYTPKGNATVATLESLTGQSNGDMYIVTDSGTLNNGALVVSAGDSVAWDSTNEVWYKTNQYATQQEHDALTTYAQNVAHSIAPEFDPNRTSENPYKAGESVTYTDGKTYTFTAPHYGPWTGSDVDDTPISPKVEALIIRDKSASTYRICADETGNALMNFVDEEGQTATPRYRARNSVPNKYKRPGTIIEYRLNGNPVSEMYLGGYNLNKWLIDCYWHNCNGDKILLDYDARMYNNYAIAVENYVKGIVCSEAIDVRLNVAMTAGKRVDLYVARFDNSTGTYSFVGKLVNLQITSSRETNSPREIIQLTKYASSDPDIYVVLDTERIAKESVETFQIGSTATSAESKELMKKCAATITVASNFSMFGFNGEISTIKNLLATYRICATETGNTLMNFVDEEGQTNTPRYRARNSVPDKYKRPGMIIEYRLNGKPVSEMYLGGYNYNDFCTDCYWMNVCDRKLLKVVDAYYYNDKRIAIENYLKDVISSRSFELHLAFYMTAGKSVDIYVARYIDGVYDKYVGKLENLQITSSREENSPLERIKLTKYIDSDPDIYVVLDTERIAKETVATFQVGSTSSADIMKKTSLNYSLEGGSSGASSYASVFNAVASHSKGLASVGSIAGVVTNDNVTIPNTADNFVAKDINDAFSASLNDMELPVAGKQKFVQPMYNNEKLYVTAFSKERMYLSLAPRRNEYDNTTQYASQYMWFAEKTDLSELVQIQFPQYMVGGESNVVGRKHGLFELANGDALVEVENGPAVNANVRQINLYKISGFNGIAIVDGVKVVPPEAVTKVLTFVSNAHLTSFNNFQEYGEGCVILAPYGSGPTARLYLSKDYGSTFDLIFCGDTTNVEVVAPKYEVTGDGTGAWPDADHVVGSPIDWTKTLNGNIHVHGIAYDPYYDRIWVVTGDGNLGEDSVTGIWWTDDEGTTWNKYGTRIELTPFCAHGTQMIDVIPMPKCVLFATDGEGDGFYRYNRNGKNGTFSIEGCYQFTGVYSQLKCLGGRYCIREDGVVFQLHHPNTSSDPNIGGVVATLNGYDIHKICDDQFAELGDGSTYKINWNSVIDVDGRTVIVSSNSGGYITFEM